MRALVMHNPKAGNGRFDRTQVCEAVESSGFSPIYYSTKKHDVPAALQQPAEMLVIAGGDGTVAKVLRHLPDRSVPIAILPSGTANNIARSLGLEAEPSQYAGLLKESPVTPLDIGIAAGPWGHRRFLEGIGFGALARSMTEDSDAPTRRERIAAGRKALRNCLAESNPQRFEIDVDGKTIDGEFLFVEVMNIGCTGPGLTLSPAAKSGDGLLDIVYLPAERREEMITWLEAEDDSAPMPVETVTGHEAGVTTLGSALRRDDKIWLDQAKPSIVRIGLEEESCQVMVPELDRSRGPVAA
jgi:diacylglycerol kinase family enzyme